MRHFSRALRAALGGLLVVASGGVAFAGIPLAGTATAAPTTTTVDIVFAQCGIAVYLCFVPPTATVSVGDTVVWTDLTGIKHDVTRCDLQDCEGHDGGTGSDTWPDGTVQQDQDFSHTFSGSGTYVYYCSIHGYAAMNGVITVADDQTSTTTTTTTTPEVSTTSTATTAPTSTTTGAAVLATSASPAASSTASNAAAADPVTRAQLPRTGSDLRLLAVGLAVAALGLVLTSAGHWTRRARRR